MGVLRDQTVIVTGASGGIGRAVAVALGSQGARVLIAGRRADNLADTAAAIERVGGRPDTHVFDLTDDAELSRFGDAAEAASGGRLAVLVHCAARHTPGSVATMNVDSFDATLKNNLRVPFVLTQRLLPALLKASGDIVFVNSSAVFNIRADHSAYTASKAALKAFADCLRAEINPLGVRVLTVYPGRTATPMQAEIFAQEGRAYQPELLLQAEDVAATILNAVLLPRTAEVTELHIRPARKL